jgi:hypothetical protein
MHAGLPCLGEGDLPALTIGFAALSALSAIVFGHVALSQINQHKGQLGGGGLAVTGLVLGYTFVGIIGLFLLIGLSFRSAI